MDRTPRYQKKLFPADTIGMTYIRQSFMRMFQLRMRHKLAKAQMIVTAINKADLKEQVSDLRETLYCGITDPIPAELLAPEEIKGDETENFAS